MARFIAEKAKALARLLVEEALREAHRDDAAIHAVYIIPERNLVVVAVLVAGERARVAFHHETLSKNPETVTQQARRFVAEELPRRDRAAAAKAE